MPDDDAREVEIESQAVIQVGKNDYIQVVKVCNRTNTDKDLWLTTKPYQRGPQPKMLGKGKKAQRITVAANECKFVFFHLPGKPHSWYTDVYRYDPDNDLHEGRPRYDWNNDVAPQPIVFPIIFPLHPFLFAYAAYPRSLEPLGKPLQFAIRSVDGLPAGWQITNLSPNLGEPFMLWPDEKEHLVSLNILVDKPDCIETLTQISISIGVSGEAQEPPYSYDINFPLVHRSDFSRLIIFTHEALDVKPWIVFSAELEDEIGLLESPYIHYSADEGRSWNSVIMELEQIGEMKPLGLSRATFKTLIPLKSFDAKIMSSLVLRDQLGQERRLKLEQYPK